MINYGTDQWTILKYPCGAGGKFLANCLFLFDKVAHWHGIESQEQTVEYFKKTILNPNEPLWLKRELNHRWNLNFFSRSYLRNNNLTLAEFNQLAEQEGSAYFKKCWDNGFKLIDHWGKPTLPEFWQRANSVSIIIDDFQLYENLVMSKLYRINYDQGVISSLLDSPDALGTVDNIKYATQFQNQHEFPLIDTHEFFEIEIKKKPWLAPWLEYKGADDQFTIKLTELLDQHTFINKFEYFENLYKQRIPTKYLIDLHTTWRIANDRSTTQYHTR